MMRRIGRAFLIAALAASVACSRAEAADRMSFSIVTGGTGGVWYPLGGAIGGVIGKAVPDTDATSEATTAAIDNLKLVSAAKAGMGFAYDYHVVWANQGKIPALKKQQPVRVVMSFYEQPLHIVTKEGTGIRTVLDIKGRRVSVGAPNSGTEEQADYVLKALGIDWNKDLKREKLGASESVSALRDGKLDAFFWSGGVPTSSIIDLASTPGLKMVLIPVGGDVAEKIMKANPAVFHKTKFAKTDYPRLDKDVDALAITAVLTAMDTFPADRMYQIVSAVFANTQEISAVWKGATILTPQRSIQQITPEALQYMHPGSARFFKEKGALK